MRTHKTLLAAGVPLAGALCILGGSSPVAAAEITPALDHAAASAPPGKRLPVIVTLRSQVDPDRFAGSPRALVAALRRTAARTQPGVVADADAPVERFWLVNAIALDATGPEIRALVADPEVASVDPDGPVEVAASDPSSVPAAGQAWGVPATGAPVAWRRTGLTGAGVRIGSIDTGVDATHPALAGKVVAWHDFVAGRTQPYDDNGHGTHTIGTMVGAAVGGAPIGVAPGASVVVAKAMGRDGYGTGSAILAAAQWMTDPDGDPATPDQPQVVNNSWGTTTKDDPWFRPMVRQWLALGIVPVFAAGNAGPGPGTIASPADYPETLAVGATTRSGAVAAFSSRGPVVWTDPDGQGPAAGTPLAKPDLVAPGEDITSSVPGGGYQSDSGTSMAAPHVAGAVALLRQGAPNLTAEETMDLLRRSAADRGPVGPDPDYGAGLLDIPAALAMAGVPFSSDQTPQATRPAQPGTGGTRSPSARTGAGRRWLSASQMLSTRRIALAARTRLQRAEQRLENGRGRPSQAAPHPRVRLRLSDMLVTRRIARATIARTIALQARLGLASGRTSPRLASRVPTRLTAAQMRATDRLARASLARASALAGRLGGSR